MYIGFLLCDKGDVVFVFNLGYFIFEIGFYFFGVDIVYYFLLLENNYILDLKFIFEDILYKIKFMFVLYLLNFVCVCVILEFYDELILFVKKYNIIIVYDNVYFDIVYDQKIGGLFLVCEGVKDVGVEFYFFFKLFNIIGVRVLFVIGNFEIIKYFKMFCF